MAKKTTKTPAKTATKKPVTMAERTLTPKQWSIVHEQLKYLTARIEPVVELSKNVAYMDEKMDRIEHMVQKATYGLKDQGQLLHSISLSLAIDIGDRLKAHTDMLNRIERLLSTPQDVTGTPADIPDQGLEPGDYTDASKEVADALTAMNLPVLSQRSLTGFSGVVWTGSQLQGDECGPGDEHRKYYPQAEFLSRASVTAKKLGLVAKEGEARKTVIGAHVWSNDQLCVIEEVFGAFANIRRLSDGYRLKDQFRDLMKVATPEEVAKYHADIEAAKPIVFGTRVRMHGKAYRVVCDGPDANGSYRLLHEEPFSKVATTRQRHEFTVIDP